MRASRFAPPCALLVTGAATAVAVATSRADDWAKPLLFVLVGVLALLADRYGVQTASGSTVVATHPVFVLGMVMLGPAADVGHRRACVLANPAATKGRMAGNVAIYGVFLTGGALLARVITKNIDASASPGGSLSPSSACSSSPGRSTLCSSPATCAGCEGRGSPRAGRHVAALLSAHIALACATAVLVVPRATIGAAVLALSGVILIAYSRLQRDLLQAERHAEAARQAATDAEAQRDGLVRIILDFLDARDHMTARHSAAVARYTRRIAEAAGCPESEQRLGHTAALYHDVGKVMFADRMFQAGKLTDEEWEIVKRHPERGAELVGHLPDHADVAEIILSHHERIDGRGYPRGLAGDAIPLLSRMISIADTYDVMTGRDSYRQPVSSAEAIEELRRVSGSQLDSDLVEIFVERVLAVEDLAFRHGDDADFEAELQVERGSRAAWRPLVPPAQLPPPALEAA